MATMPPSDHIVWKLLFFTVAAGLLLGILALNATNFDATEIRSWLQMLLALIGLRGAESLVKRKAK